MRLRATTVAVSWVVMMSLGVAALALDVDITYLEYSQSGSTFRVQHQPAGGPKVQISARAAITAPAYSPDGVRIAFAAATGDPTLGLYAIFTANRDGSGVLQVTPGSHAEFDPAWSPDGSTIVFAQNTGGSISASACCRLARVPATGGTVTALTAAVGAVRPDFSPRGNLITYDTPSGVWTISPNGGRASLVATGGWSPSFSPDGDRIAYLARSGSNVLIRTVGISGGSATTVYSTARSMEALTWRGSSIWFLEFDGLGYEGRRNVQLRRVPAGGGSAVTEAGFSGRIAEASIFGGDPAARLAGTFGSGTAWGIAALQGGRRLVLRSGGSSFSIEDWGAISPGTGWALHLVGDFNGDGLTDTAGYRPADGTWRVSRSTGSSFSTSTWATFSTRTGWATHLVGDFNGDGRDDIVSYHPSNGSWWVSRSTGSGFSTSRWATYSTRTGWATHLVGNFCGSNSRDDLASYHPSNGTWWVSCSTGSGFSSPRLWATFSTRTGWATHLVGDFNGDGRDDIVSYHPSNGSWWVSRSTGSGFSTSRWATFSTRTGWATHLVGDFNGDGRDDIASYHPSNGTWWVSRSTGSSFSTSRWAP